MRIVISSGHGKYVAGASGPEPWGLDEVDEARRIVNEVASWLTLNGHAVEVLHDDVSKDQSDNLSWIVSHHNAFPAEGRLDVSVHLNAYLETTGGRGVEVCYITQKELAQRVAQAISSVSGLILRGDAGAVKRSDLYFLNGTTGSEGAILVETCFVDAMQDCEDYREHFSDIVDAIADTLVAGEDEEYETLHTIGKVSHFGGEDDTGVDADEGLAFIFDYEDKPEIFLDEQPEGTTGLARRLDTDGSFYVALRFDYDVFPKEMLAGPTMALVKAQKTGRSILFSPADWGPHTSTGRVADCSKRTLEYLGIETDDIVEVIYPAPDIDDEDEDDGDA